MLCDVTITAFRGAAKDGEVWKGTMTNDEENRDSDAQQNAQVHAEHVGEREGEGSQPDLAPSLVDRR